MSVGETDASQIVDESKEEDIGKYKGEESIFKRPMPKLKRPSHRPRKQSLPLKKMPADHGRNPQKWIKYSLASTSEMTDRSNTAAAFSFLREMEERKAKEAQQQEEQLDGNKVVFKKPKTREDQASSSSRGYRDGKLLMPAFEFGSKKAGHKKKSKQAESTGSAGRTMTLQHLADPDGESSSDWSYYCCFSLLLIFLICMFNLIHFNIVHKQSKR